MSGATHPFATIRQMVVDYTAGTLSVLFVDGRLMTSKVDVPRDHGLVTRSTFFPSRSCLEFVAGGASFQMALGTGQDRLDVPVVYLDQKDWIYFARWRNQPASVDTAAAPFYEALARAADAERVVLPLSSAHLTETSKRGGRSRLDLAATMLQYSRGWQLRTVLGLRRAELRALFGGTPVTRAEAITLHPEAVLDMQRKGASSWEPSPDLGPELGALVRRQTWASVLVSLLLDDAPQPDDSVAKVTQWAESFAPLAEAMRGNARAKQHARALTRLRFIADLGTDLPAAAKEQGFSGEQFAQWLENDAEGALSLSPGLGRMRELLHLRLVNADDKWHPHDLNDWMHLSYAAAYSDLVVGDKKFIHYLRRSQGRNSPGAVVHKGAADALPDLLRILGEV